MKTSLRTLLALMAIGTAHATPFTETSPTSGGAVPTGVTRIGGIVLDAIGTNGIRLVAQLSANSLFAGFATTNPQTIGTQMGLTAGLMAQLGGGFAELAIRVSLHDGDNSFGTGNFDVNQNFLLVNGVNVGNWTDVIAERTDSTGVTSVSFSSGGFRNGILDTGWFHVTNSTVLASVYNSIVSTGMAVYAMDDVDPGDNEYNFSLGISGGLINTNVPPVVSGNVPDGGSTLLLMGAAFGVLGMLKRRSKV